MVYNFRDAIIAGWMENRCFQLLNDHKNTDRGRVHGKGRGTPLSCLKLRCAEGREFDPRPGQYIRMSFSSDQVTGTDFPHLNIPFLPNSEFF